MGSNHTIPWIPWYYTFFYSELHQHFPNNHYDSIAHNHIKSLSNYISGGISSISLFGGIAGIAFSVLGSSIKGQRYTKLLQNLDNVLVKESKALIEQETIRKEDSASPQFYDVIQGFSGVGRYFLERVDYVQSHQELIVDILKLFTRFSEPFILNDKEIPSWYVSKDHQFLEKDMRLYPNGNFNLGLAHGIPGPLAFLSLCTLKGIEIPKQRETIAIICDWLIEKSTLNNYGYTVWPHRPSLEDILNNNSESNNEREGWCYGNPGIARSLYLAGLALKNESYKEISLNCFKGICDKPFADLDLISPTFCHGKAGLLQILKRMKQDTQNNLFDSRIKELTNTLTSQYSFDSPLGFKDLEINDNTNRLDKAGLLEGSSGTILSLLPLIKNETYWDKAFLIA